MDDDDLASSVTSSLLLGELAAAGGGGGSRASPLALHGGGMFKGHDLMGDRRHSEAAAAQHLHSSSSPLAHSAASSSSHHHLSISSRLYDLEDRSLHASLSAHLSGDCSHPKRLAFLTQYVSGLLFLLFALSLPFFPRQHLHHASQGPHSGEGDNGFGRTWIAFLMLFQGVHQLALGYASSVSLNVLQSHELEYYEHNFWGVLAYAMGGLSHLARSCLLWDVLQAHGETMGEATLLLMMGAGGVMIVYAFYAYRSSLSPVVAAVSAALLSLFLSIALFHASSLNHVAPGAAIGAAVGLWMYAILVYPMMCVASLRKYTWMLEAVNILCWTWLMINYNAFDNCVM